jgi:nitrite reductase (NADH) large subunit
LFPAGRVLFSLRSLVGSQSPAAHANSIKRRLIVVGNGMVGQRFCERMVELGGTERFAIEVLSEEATPAYDRVHLGDYLRGRSARDLLLREAEWFGEHGIELRLNERVVAIDTARRRVKTARGIEREYDKLVLATGSHAVIPQIPLTEGAEVIAYRTLEDAQRVLESVRDGRARERLVVVLGGGLLGIEAARTVQTLGCRVRVLEASSQLLPRQLDPDAAQHLERRLAAAGLEISLKSRVTSVRRVQAGVVLTMDDGTELECGSVIAAVGARASDDLGKRSGLRCHLRGGVEVDGWLKTSTDDVYAIGECASHAGVPHGLVAPGYAMADLLAGNLMGSSRRLGPQDVITRLKLDVTQVTVLGDPVGVECDVNLIWRNDDRYRRLLVRKRRVVAAIAIGDWDELAALQGVVTRKRRVSRRALARFQRDGTLGLTHNPPPAERMSDATVVCQCANVTCGVLRRALSSGHCDAPALSRATGAGTLCGSCQPVLVALSTGRSARPAGQRLFAIAAAAALVIAVATLLAPRIPLATSVLEQTIDFFFTNSLAKQISGFGLVAVLAFGLLFSLRKRIARFRWATYARLRTWHGVLGVCALLGLFAHTGFRLGSNLNLALSLLFLTSAVTGALAGLCGRAGHPRVRLMSTVFRRTHEITFWPLPALMLFHALKTYYF